jgi:hypothetical protein
VTCLTAMARRKKGGNANTKDVKCNVCGNAVQPEHLAAHLAKKHPKGVKAVVYGGSSDRSLALNRKAARVVEGEHSLLTYKFPDLLISRLGRTPAGRAWALTALHPCGKGELLSPALGDLAGMPDTMTGAVVTPAYPGETYIVWDESMFTTPPTPPLTGTWGVDIVIPPIPEIDYLYRIRYDAQGTGGTALLSNWRVVRVANMDLPPEATATEPVDITTLRGTTFATMGYGKVRQIASGHTFQLDVSALNDQGRIVAAQIEGQWTQTSIGAGRFIAGATPAESNILTNNYGNTDLRVLNIPVDPSVLVAACPNAYQANARFGAYVVQKFSSPLLGYQFKNTGDDAQFFEDEIEADTPAMMPMSAFALNTKGYLPSAPLLDNAEIFVPDSSYGGVIGASLPTPRANVPIASNDQSKSGIVAVTENRLHPWVSHPSDMMVSVITFRNLALIAAAGGTGVIRVKSRNYFECIPSAQNPATTPFTHNPAPYDPKALEAVIFMGKLIADGYPSSYNDVGQMLGEMWDGLKEIAEPVASELGKFNIPVVSPIAKQLAHSGWLRTNADRMSGITNADKVNSLVARANELLPAGAGEHLKLAMGLH